MRVNIFVSLLFILPSTAALADFVGTIKLIPPECQQSDYCELEEDFGFIDKRGLGWQADKGDRTDGASIPKWARKFAGDPWDSIYLNAAVLHDHYSKSVRPVRGWFETQRMFHEALLASGVSRKQAAVLFSGVLIGSGKWIIRMTGKKCQTGKVCSNNVGDISLETEPESFEEPSYSASFKRLRAKIEASDDLTEEEIVKLAIEERPDSIYLQNLNGLIKIDLDDWPFAGVDR